MNDEMNDEAVDGMADEKAKKNGKPKIKATPKAITKTIGCVELTITKTKVQAKILPREMEQVESLRGEGGKVIKHKTTVKKTSPLAKAYNPIKEGMQMWKDEEKSRSLTDRLDVELVVICNQMPLPGARNKLNTLLAEKGLTPRIPPILDTSQVQ